MTTKEAIEIVLMTEIDKGQDAWEMLMNGYNGDIDAYIADYEDDYTASEIGNIIYVVRYDGQGGGQWIVDGTEVTETDPFTFYVYSMGSDEFMHLKTRRIADAKVEARTIANMEKKKVEIRVFRDGFDPTTDEGDYHDYDTVDFWTWYAVQNDSEDEWNWGSYDYAEAVRMLKEHEHGQIAVINTLTSVCEREIPYEEV